MEMEAMKVSDIYGQIRKPPVSKPEEKPAGPSPLSDSMLCRRGVDIWLNHKWGPGWICRRCGAVADIKGLLK